jgi:hypothetical protein
MSEIEARLTPDTMWAAEDAYDSAVREPYGGETIEDGHQRSHQAWLNVILAALGKK